MKKIANYLVLALVSATCFSACSNGSFKYIEEDTTTTNILDDKYRNYYEIFVASYYDSDGDGMGDLRGVAQKLDYIKSTGYNGIWLMPIFVSPTYHKYNAIDYYTIEPGFGTQEDLDYLIEECHKRDIDLILDLVLNHCSQQSPWFKKSSKAYAKKLAGHTLTNEEEKWSDLFVYKTTPTGEVDEIVDEEYNVSFFVQSYLAKSDMPEFNHNSAYCNELFKGVVNTTLIKALMDLDLMQSRKSMIVLKKMLNFLISSKHIAKALIPMCLTSVNVGTAI